MKYLWLAVYVVIALQPDYVTEMPQIAKVACTVKKPILREQYLRTYYQSNGLIDSWFDTNEDGKMDMVVSTQQGIIHHYPLFYAFDQNYDGLIDLVLVDKSQDGTCEAIYNYWVRGYDPKEQI